MDRSPRKSAERWAALITEFDAGSESELDFCQRHVLKLVTLRKWRYRYKSPTPQRTSKIPQPFIKMNVQNPVVQQSSAVLCIGQDIRLECPASFDVSSLAQLALTVHYGR